MSTEDESTNSIPNEEPKIDFHAVIARRFSSDILRFYELAKDIIAVDNLSLKDAAELEDIMQRQKRMANNYTSLMNGDYS